MRAPIAYGFYPRRKPELEDMLRNLFSGVTSSCGLSRICGAIVPHAGYPYSGKVAACIYSLLPKTCNTVILLGTDHAGLAEKAAVSRERWQTPIGIVETDTKLAEKIVTAGGGFIRFDEEAHIQEHSIEVQLPFLQHIFLNFKIVAISVSSNMDIEDYEEIADAVDGSAPKDAIIIASSDFTHFGECYGFAPTAKNRAEWVKKTDAQLVDAVLSLDAKKFLERAENSTACGTGPIAVLVSIMKKRAKLAKMAEYGTSFDVSGDDSAIVGYAGIVFGE